jgi:hypothetical protein
LSPDQTFTGKFQEKLYTDQQWAAPSKNRNLDIAHAGPDRSFANDVEDWRGDAVRLLALLNRKFL